ncbi:3-oxoacyl-[acyl-carrier-protein] synthase III C-terminal domain-containing protein [Streptacidiphilus anmyonensis]|uniref:3-oxoacyl-[acyl-carrier-protein] synthase III C-terminal domain-containing protein n=1 Tax=Streptacidiphilus anmyonensis TaxID=405782 RepID=UPI0005AB8B2A|nr:3-oxoacyl-[acyl-carrier-protein] synthase III C-terminal domain-containing protein [Streptacidiphilus anmyonensis]
MITLEAVESYVPERTVGIEDRAAELDLTPEQIHMFRRHFGLDRMRYDPAAELIEQLLPAAERALGDTPRGDVRHLLFGHALHGAGHVPPDTARELARRLGLEHATAFALTQQNCAVSMSALDVAGSLLEAGADPSARALVVVGDKPRTRAAQLIMNTCIVADGTAAALVAVDGPGVPVRSFATRTLGQFSDGMLSTPETLRNAAELRPTVLAEVMTEAAGRAGCSLDDVQWFIPSNPNLVFWRDAVPDEDLRARFYLDNVPRLSHCLAADVLANYTSLREEKRLRHDRPVMFVAIGVGMTFSAMVVTPGVEHGAVHG